MVWAFVAAWTPSNPHLSVTKPTMRLCSKRIIIPIIEVIVLTVVTHAACFALLNSAEWYHGSRTGTHIQNPGITLAWSIANYVLQGQIMGFKLDTWPHCLSPTSNPPLIVITLIFIFFAHFFVAAGFLFTHLPLALFRFPDKFRNKLWGILLGAAALFVIIRALRQVVLRKQHARQHQALQRSSGGSRLSTAGGSLGSADVTTLRAQSLRELSTRFRWLTLRAPKIAPLVHGLPGEPETQRSTLKSGHSAGA
ncbi:hypothetical protein ABBQ32_000901 [Trebouxia sp. C0010 RCD-2024]